MKLDTVPFPIGMVELMNKKVLVCMDQAEMTKRKSVVIFDDRRYRIGGRPDVSGYLRDKTGQIL
jgi:hypothetical protein